MIHQPSRSPELVAPGAIALRMDEPLRVLYPRRALEHAIDDEHHNNQHDGTGEPGHIHDERIARGNDLGGCQRVTEGVKRGMQQADEQHTVSSDHVEASADRFDWSRGRAKPRQPDSSPKGPPMGKTM